MMRARLQIDIKSRSTRPLAGFFDGKDLRVLHAVVRIKSFAYDIALVIDQQRAHVGIGRGEAKAALRQFQRALKVSMITFRGCAHDWHSRSREQ